MKNLAGNYSSVDDFISINELEEKAKEILGINWEAENDVEQIQKIVGTEYSVKVLVPTTKREERIDEYIIVEKISL